MTESLALHHEPDHPFPADGMVRGVAPYELTPDAIAIMQESVREAGIASLEAAGIMNLSEVTYSNGDKTYFGTYGGPSDGFMEQESTVLIDTDAANQVSGVARIDYFRQFKGMPGLVDAPFVGFTGTDPAFRRQGLAERRLFAMNAISQECYGRPLHSGTHQATGVEPMWDKLVQSGAAIALPAGGEFRYSFRPDA